MTPTDTPRTDACPHCGAEAMRTYMIGGKEVTQHICGSWSDSTREERTDLCREREKSQKLEAEVERLRAESRVGNIALDNIRGELDLTYQRWREAEKSRDEWMTKAISRSAN